MTTRTMNVKAKGFIMILLWIVIIAILGAVVMLLWNFLIPGIFGLAAINIW